MKKIGILAFGNRYGGGVHQYTQSIIDALGKDKKNKYILFLDSNNNEFDKYDLEVRKIDKPKTNVIKKIIRAFQHLLLIRRAWFFTKYELNIFNDIDIFLSPAISGYPHFYMNKPFVFTLHDMQERYYPEFFSKFEKFIRWLNNRALSKTAYKIICESCFVKNDIVQFLGVSESKIYIIQSPPPNKFLNYNFNENYLTSVKKKYNLPNEFIFYPAQCWFHKNHINLVRAFKIVEKKYTNVYLVLTGSKQNNYSNLMQEIKKLNLENKVLHLGYINYEDLPYLYKMSFFLIIPTFFESISIPIYEAFSLAVPVCCSNVVAIPEQVGNAGLIFNPHDTIDMSEKMIMYLNDKKLRNKKAKLGYKKIMNFSYAGYKFKLGSLFDV